MGALKRCPFCGGEAELSRGLHNYDAWGVWCPTCKVSTGAYYLKKDDAAAVWNKRAAVTDEQFSIAVHDGRMWKAVD